MKRTILGGGAAVAALAATLLGGLVSPVAAAVPDTEIRPARLERGANGAVPHVDGRRLVDGDLSFRFGRAELRYLGRTGGDYVVARWGGQSATNRKVIRVSPAGERTTLLSDKPVWEMRLSADGQHLLKSRWISRDHRSVIRLWSAVDGSPAGRRGFRGVAEILGADAGRVLLTIARPDRTLWWDTADGSTSRVSDRAAYTADLRNDRLAVMDGDPYRGGCSVLSTISDPSTTIWRSCDRAVAGFAPGGDRLVTVHLLSDGLGPGELQLHEGDGTALARYTAYWFSGWTWEGDHLLMEAHSRRKVAWVRCVLDECERAGRLRASNP
ncbi:hypothetical protein ACFP3Q_15720 [Nocardioides sp. GCM10027113]|uniref:hypothetical protein n=1 Tax=unclassified Nocardioides TaxID=2615069 RepID=UPI00360DCF2C